MHCVPKEHYLAIFVQHNLKLCRKQSANYRTSYNNRNFQTNCIFKRIYQSLRSHRKEKGLINHHYNNTGFYDFLSILKNFSHDFELLSDILFILTLLNVLQLFVQYKTSGNELPQLLFIWKCLNLFLTVKDDFIRCRIDNLFLF